MNIVKFQENSKTSEGYGIFVSKDVSTVQLTGVVYNKDGSEDESAQVVEIPATAIVKEIQVQEKPVNATYTSTKFSRSITRRYISQLE